MKEKKVFGVNKTVAQKIKLEAEHKIFRAIFLKYNII